MYLKSIHLISSCFLQIFVDILGPLLLLRSCRCCRPCNPKWKPSKTEDDADIMQLIQHKNRDSQALNQQQPQQEKQDLSSSSSSSSSSVPQDSIESNIHNIERYLSNLINSLGDFAANHMIKQKETLIQADTSHQWKAIGKAMDRLFVLVYLGCIIVSLWVLFPVPPQEFLFGSQ